MKLGSFNYLIEYKPESRGIPTYSGRARKIEREERDAGLTLVAEYTDKWKTGRRTEPDCELPE